MSNAQGLLPYRRVIPAGGTEKIEVRGRTIVMRDVVGRVSVTARRQLPGESGVAYTLEMGKFEKWFMPENGEFTQVELTNADENNPRSVELLIGHGDFVREVTSRSISSKFFNADRFAIDCSELAPGIYAMPDWFQENLQRKRLVISADCADSAVRFVVGAKTENEEVLASFNTELDVEGDDFRATVFDPPVLRVKTGAYSANDVQYTITDWFRDTSEETWTLRLAGPEELIPHEQVPVDNFNVILSKIGYTFPNTLTPESYGGYVGGNHVYSWGDSTSFTDFEGPARFLVRTLYEYESVFGPFLKADGVEHVFETTAAVSLGVVIPPGLSIERIYFNTYEETYDA